MKQDLQWTTEQKLSSVDERRGLLVLLFCHFEDACEFLGFCVGAGQDFQFNFWISQSGHKLVIERTREMVSEFAVDGIVFQSVAEINEPLCPLLLTCPEGEQCSC